MHSIKVSGVDQPLLKTPGWQFIANESLDLAGEAGERKVWDIVRRTFSQGQGVAVWGFRTYCHEQQSRQEIDILIVSRELGLVVIEVKSCRLDQIAQVQGKCWQMQNFYKPTLAPFRQAESQLWRLLDHCKQHPALKEKVPGRVIVALPQITRETWQARGFEDGHHTCPPLLFANDLVPQTLYDRLKHHATILERGTTPLEWPDPQWNLLLKVVGFAPKPPEFADKPLPLPSPPLAPSQAANSPPRRSEVIAQLQTWVSEVDWQQVAIGMQIPPGPQRIRGIAGSGKTLLLCQKAARMHLKYPDWDIGLVFFTRSLYDLVIGLVDQWLRYFSGGEVGYDPAHSKLKILHAWGSQEQLGLYSLIAREHHISRQLEAPLDPNFTIPQRLVFLSRRLLTHQQGQLTPLFDALLIDEGQDLATNTDLKLEDKQAFYWMAWQILRPIDSNHPHRRRLIWAYDEAQSLDSLTIPEYKELFGTQLGDLLSGRTEGPIYEGGIKKNEVMERCYRTPGPILMAAHAIGMGLLRPEGMLTGLTRAEGWRDLGYEVTGDFRRPGSRIVLHRPRDKSPNPLPQLWGQHPLEFQVYPDRETELEALAQKIQFNLETDGLQASRDILVIVLGKADEEHPEGFKLHSQVRNFLQRQGIDYYIPGTIGKNRWPERSSRNPNQFWEAEAVTVSRIHRAKGHEAYQVYIVGLDAIARDESNIQLRNQLFVALTRSAAWVHLSGIQDPETKGDYPLYEEIRSVIASGETLEFIYQRPPKWQMGDAA